MLSAEKETTIIGLMPTALTSSEISRFLQNYKEEFSGVGTLPEMVKWLLLARLGHLGLAQGIASQTLVAALLGRTRVNCSVRQHGASVPVACIPPQTKRW